MSEVKRGDGAKAWVVLHQFMWGPFGSAAEAHAFAKRQWPDEEHDVQALHDPETL